MKILDVLTVAGLLEEDPESYHRRWASAEEEQEYGRYEQYLSRCLHYFAWRHPGSDLRLIATAAILVTNFATGRNETFGQDRDPLFRKVEWWLLWFAAGHQIPKEDTAPPLRMARPGEPIPPGGDPAAFTKAAVAVLEALVWAGEGEAAKLATEFLSRSSS